MLVHVRKKFLESGEGGSCRCLLAYVAKTPAFTIEIYSHQNTSRIDVGITQDIIMVGCRSSVAYFTLHFYFEPIKWYRSVVSIK